MTKDNQTQVILKIPTKFMKRFDETSEQEGYTRTEAIREAMRKFVQETEIKTNERNLVNLQILQLQKDLQRKEDTVVSDNRG